MPSPMVHLSYLISFLFLSDTDMSFTFLFFFCLAFILPVLLFLSLIVSLYLSCSCCILHFFFFIVILLKPATSLSLLFQCGLSMLHLLASLISLSIFYLSFSFYTCHIHFCLPFYCPTLFTSSPSHLPSFHLILVCLLDPSLSSLSSLLLSPYCPVHRIISKMPGIFLTVWQFWVASLTSWSPSLGWVAGSEVCRCKCSVLRSQNCKQTDMILC